MIDLNDIALFVAVAEDKSFTVAARRLGLPKSTLSRRITGLEEQLGARLLQRTTRQVKLTDVGDAFFERCSQIVADAEDARQAVMQLQQHPRGRLRVTAPPLFAEAYLAEVLATFGARHPEVRVELVVTDRLVDLVEEGFDLAIRAGRLPDSSLIARKLGPSGLVLVASPEYLAARGTPQRPVDLAEHDCLVFGLPPGPHVWRFEGARGTQTVAVTPKLLANSFGVTRAVAQAGLGVAILPTFMAAADMQSGRLVRVLPGHEPPEGAIWAVYPSNRHLSAKVRALVDTLADAFGDPAPWVVA